MIRGTRLVVCTALALAATTFGAPEKKKPTTPATRSGAKTAPKSSPSPKASPAAPRATLESAASAEVKDDEAQKFGKAAMDAFKKGELPAAKKGFQRVLELAPDNLTALINLGLIAQREKEYADSEKFLKRAVRVQPEAGVPWVLLGITQYEQNKLDAALASLAQAVYLEPKDARAHHYLGVTVGRKGWYSGAEEEVRRAIELDPDYAEAHYNLAVFYLQRVPPAVELARRHYQKSIDLGGAPDPEVAKKIGEPQ